MHETKTQNRGGVKERKRTETEESWKGGARNEGSRAEGESGESMTWSLQRRMHEFVTHQVESTRGNERFFSRLA